MKTWPFIHISPLHYHMMNPSLIVKLIKSRTFWSWKICNFHEKSNPSVTYTTKKLYYLDYPYDSLSNVTNILIFLKKSVHTFCCLTMCLDSTWFWRKTNLYDAYSQIKAINIDLSDGVVRNHSIKEIYIIR